MELNKMKGSLVIALFMSLLLFLQACVPSEAAIKLAIEQTQTAQPTPTSTPTPTKIPSKDLDLSEIIHQYELPKGYYWGTVTEEAHPILQKSTVKPINMISQDLKLNNDTGGMITLELFETSEIAQDVFEDIVFQSPPMEIFGDTSETSYDFGEEAYGLQSHISVLDLYVIIFHRCNAVVAIQVDSVDGYYGIQEYAKNLDNRLMDLICGEN